MKRFVVKTFSFSLIAGICCLCILSLIDHRFIPGPKKMFFQEKAPKKLDLLIMGSSRAEHVLNPQFFSPEFKVYNFAMDGHGLPSNYLLLKSMIEKHGLQVGQIILSVDEFNFNGTVGFSRKFRDDFFIDDIDDPEVYEAYEKYRGKSFASILKLLPQTSTVIYSDVRKTIRNFPFLTRSVFDGSHQKHESALNEFNITKGYSPLSSHKLIENTNEKEQYVIEPDDLDYFNKLVELCKKNHIKLSLFRAPVLYCNNYVSNDFDQFISSFTKQNNIAFYDYKCSYQLANQYYDNTHPTDSISKMVSMDISSKLHPILAENKKADAVNKPFLITMLQ